MSTAGYKLVRLANGVCSVHSLAYRETFHPVIGPAAEAEALYVRQLRLADRLEQHRGEFVIWDVSPARPPCAHRLKAARGSCSFACSASIKRSTADLCLGAPPLWAISRLKQVER